MTVTLLLLQQVQLYFCVLHPLCVNTTTMIQLSVHVNYICGHQRAPRAAAVQHGVRKVYARAYANHGANKWREIEDKVLDT